MENYTIVKKPAITIVGIACRTSNNPEEGPVDISKHWEKFFSQGIMDKIPHKISNEVFALYCDYEGDYTQPYSLVIGCPVNSTENIPNDMVAKIIPESSYAVFRAIGEHPQSLINTWGEIWKTNLKRIYTGDYELYSEKFSASPQEVEVFIAIQPTEIKVVPYDILQYCNGKDLFVADIDAKDGFSGCRMVQALTDREWSAVRNLRNKYFFHSFEDPYTWTFDHKNHIHFVFYKDAEIIGYCHLQLWPEQRSALRIIVIDEKYRKHGLGGQFLQACERWLKHQEYKELCIQSSQEAYPFYSKHGYVKMPFQDPEGYETDPRDIEIGKIL